MNRSTSEQIGTKHPGTHGRIEVILSFCSKCRRGLQALVPKWRDYTFIPMSYSCPCVSFSSLFYSCSLRTPWGEIDALSGSLISATLDFIRLYRWISQKEFINAVGFALRIVFVIQSGTSLWKHYITSCKLLIFWSSSTTVTFCK